MSYHTSGLCTIIFSVDKTYLIACCCDDYLSVHELNYRECTVIKFIFWLALYTLHYILALYTLHYIISFDYESFFYSNYKWKQLIWIAASHRHSWYTVLSFPTLRVFLSVISLVIYKSSHVINVTLLEGVLSVFIYFKHVFIFLISVELSK